MFQHLKHFPYSLGSILFLFLGGLLFAHCSGIPASSGCQSDSDCSKGMLCVATRCQGGSKNDGGAAVGNPDLPSLPPEGQTKNPEGQTKNPETGATSPDAGATSPDAGAIPPEGRATSPDTGSTSGILPHRRLAIPKEMKGKVKEGVRVFSLTLQRGTHEFLQGKKTKTYGINGSYLGPTLRVKKGEKVQFNIKNKIGETTTIHWHGMHIPAKMDGGPHQMIKPNETWVSSYTILQPASVNWYHPHLEGKTGEHVYKGLAGLLLIDDAASSKLDIPSTYGVDDIPLVIQDRRFAQDASFSYLSQPVDRMAGMKGDKIMANGVIDAQWAAPAQMIRVRILNGSNARYYNVGIHDGRAFHLIATEGGLLEKPVSLTRLPLAPGERAEILIDLSQDSGKKIRITSYSSELPSPGGMMGMMGRDALDQKNFTIMEMIVSKPALTKYTLPTQLVTPAKLPESLAQKTRRFVFNMGMGGMGGGGGGFTINNKKMDMNRIDEVIKLGAVEIWEIRNISPMAHPFHVHDVSFLILSRNGKPPAKHEAGWKDTVNVTSRGSVRFIAKFADFADPKSPYMYHCHILEHEDAGMMGQFIVVK